MEWAGHHKAGHQGHHLNYFPQNRCCPNKRKSLENIDFSRLWWRKRWDSNPRALADNCISSAARYNHFDTLPCINIHFWGLITWFRVSHLRPLGQLSVYLKCNPCSGRMQEKHARTIWNCEIRTCSKACAADIFSGRNSRSFQKYHVDHITVDSTSIDIIISYSDSVCNYFSR